MNKSYAITCSSTADLPESYLSERGIPYACFHFYINNKEFNDDLGRSVPIEEFYQKIRDGAMPTTSQVNPEQYTAMFEPLLKEGKDIIHLTLSSGISGTYNSAVIARMSCSSGIQRAASRLLIHCQHRQVMAFWWIRPGRKCRPA